ncbi:MAG: MFS transporter, partial [Alterinioella nitratireducens]
RSFWLFICLLFEGIALMIFSQMQVLFLAIPSLIVFSLFTQMAEGATYSVVPFINKKALGAVAGVVGAGGNAGAVLAGFLFKNMIDWSEAFFILGIVVTCASFLAFFVRFSTRQEDEERANFAAANIETLRRRAERANAELEEGLIAIRSRDQAPQPQ